MQNAVMVPRECAPEGTDCDGPYLMRPHGLDSVEFFFAAGPDEPLRPLSAVASGGEAARLMLAIKAAPSLLRGSNADGCGEDESLFEEEVLADDEGDGADKFGAAPSITIFDEIDSSIGSRLGMPVGRILRRMAGVQGTGAAQVLCVSHLPQVAAYGQYHICVRKDVERAGGRVSTRFDVLSSEEDRVAEVAAMLGLTREAAEELLRMSSQDGLVGAFE